MEYGVDARHAALYVDRPDPPEVPSQRSHLWPSLRLPRELYPAAQPRRDGARQRISDRQDGGRPLAALRQSARLSGLYVDAARQEASVHGCRVCAGARVEPRHWARLAASCRSRPRRSATAGARSELSLSQYTGAPQARLRCRWLSLDRRGERSRKHYLIRALRI